MSDEQHPERQPSPPPSDAPAAEHTHASGLRCPACDPPPAHTPADEAAIQADPATRSLARALAVTFSLLKLLMLIMVAVFLLGNITFVKQGNVGLVRRFGAYLRDGDGKIIQYPPGRIVFVWPLPIESFREVSTQVQTLTLGREFWPKRRRAQEALDRDAKIVPVMDDLDPASDHYNLTGDLNILHSRWQVRWRVVAPVRYQLAVAASGAGDRKPAPVDVLRELVVAAIMRNMAGMSVDEILYRNARTLFERIKDDVARQLLDAGGHPWLGIGVENVTNDLIVPPGKTLAAFDAVIGARSEQKKLESAAMAEAEKILKTARSRANKIVTDARAYQAEVVNRAKGDARRLTDILAKFPGDAQGLHLYLQQYRYDVLKEVLGKSTVYVLRHGQNWFIFGGQASQVFEEKSTKEKP